MSVSPTSQKIHDLVIRSFTKVFETMARATCVFQDYELHSGTKSSSPKLDPAKDGSDQVFAASVTFAGRLNGTCYLFLSNPFAHHISSEITGIPMEKLRDAAVRDVCGELANMFTGTFTSALADLGHSISLSVPTVKRGKRVAIAVSGTSSHVRYAFDVNDYRVHADVLLMEN